MIYTRIITFLLVFSAFSGAIAADLFTVDGVKVSSNGGSAKQAKEAAVLAGQREAFAKLLERVASGQPAIDTTAIEPEAMAEMVQGIEVNDEKITASYYSATLSISFNRSFVEKFLKGRNIGFSDKKSAPIVIAPVLIGGDGAKSVFESKNQWRKAVEEMAAANHVLNITVLPSLRGVDKERITQDISALDKSTRDDLLKIGQSYNADKFILAIAVQNTGVDNLTMYMQDLKDQRSAPREISIKNSDLQPGETLFSRSAKNVTAILEGQWIKAKTEDTSIPSRITIRVPISGLEEWSYIRGRLEGFQFLKGVDVKSLNVQYGIVEISFKDTVENISIKLKENGMALENTSDGLVLHVIR